MEGVANDMAQQTDSPEHGTIRTRVIRYLHFRYQNVFEVREQAEDSANEAFGDRKTYGSSLAGWSRDRCEIADDLCGTVVTARRTAGSRPDPCETPRWWEFFPVLKV